MNRHSSMDTPIKTSGINEALLLEVNAEDRASFRLRKHTFLGRGLQQGVTKGDWDILRDRIYEVHD